MSTKINLPMEIWLEILQSIERIELAKRLSLTNRLIHAAAHIRLHQEGKQVLGNLRFQRRPKLNKNDRNCTELFKIGINGLSTKVPIAQYELPANIVDFREIEIRFGICVKFLGFF